MVEPWLLGVPGSRAFSVTYFYPLLPLYPKAYPRSQLGLVASSRACPEGSSEPRVGTEEKGGEGVCVACGWVPGDVNNTQAVTTLISPPQNISYGDSTHSCPTPPQTGRDF